MLQNMLLHKRIDERKRLKKECTLLYNYNLIKTQTVDISEMGLGVETNRTVPFKDGCELDVSIPNMAKLFQAKLIWTKKDVENNATRLGLKLSKALFD